MDVSEKQNDQEGVSGSDDPTPGMTPDLPDDAEAKKGEPEYAVRKALSGGSDSAEALDVPVEEEEEVVDMNVKPLEEFSGAEDEAIKMDWYILKVQSNRERSICDGLRRRVMLEGLDKYFGDILVPTEDVAEYKNGKRRVVKRKLYPGYICVNMSINEETWFLVRETSGVGDFTGAAGKPSPMLPHEIDRIIKKPVDDEDGDDVKTTIPFDVGDRVRIKDGTFENFEGDVDGIDEGNGKVTIMINIFGRSTPVELEHWQIEDI